MSGHGHVTPNPDGSKARCGGPRICSQCAKEAAALKTPPATTMPPAPAQEMFCCAVVSDTKMDAAQREKWLHECAHDYWRKYEAAEAAHAELWRVSFQRITSLRLALRDLADGAEAGEPASMHAALLAQNALDADDDFVGEGG